MARRPGKAPGPQHLAGAAEVQGGFRDFLAEFLEAMKVRGFSAHTLKNRRISVGYFIDWCEARDIARPSEVTRAILERYRRHVFHYRRPDTGAPLTLDSQGQRLTAVRVFFQWLTRQHHLLYNPASELELPRQQVRLPRHVLTVAEIEQILAAIDIAEPLGLRDRAMLETLYSTGMRRAELAALRIDDVSIGRGTVLIRQGKGCRDRVVPIGARALAWVEKYLYEIRPSYLDGEEHGGLFLAVHGEPMQAKQLSNIVRKAIQRADLERFRTVHPNAACHLFRHACATHMLENGADIRAIQALLGHASLSTTQVYTQVSILHLKAVHEKTHPARLDRTPDPA
jgi:integrase/recombinase XerD